MESGEIVHSTNHYHLSFPKPDSSSSSKTRRLLGQTASWKLHQLQRRWTGELIIRYSSRVISSNKPNEYFVGNVYTAEPLKQVCGPVAASSWARRMLHLQPRPMDREQAGMTSLFKLQLYIAITYSHIGSIGVVATLTGPCQVCDRVETHQFWKYIFIRYAKKDYYY